LLEQLKVKFPHLEGNSYITDGVKGKIVVSLDDWLSIHITEMVKEAVLGAREDEVYSVAELELYDEKVRAIIKRKILQTLGIEK